ncbi:MAG: GntR family transcriptional regulator, partial [Casimicrobiaceae bacterium]
MKSEASTGGPGGARGAGLPAARTPRYEKIHRQLVNDIRDGRYPVGAKLPPELELCATFAASRHTVREAIRRLTEQGLIARRAGAGTMVLRRTRSGGFTQQISALPDLLAYVKGAQLEVLEARDIRASATEALLLRCRRGQAWHRLVALKHLRGARKPVAYVLAYVHRDHPALKGVLDRRGVALHDFIEERIEERIATVEQELSAKPLRGREAKALSLAPGYAGFVIARRYLSASGTVVLVTSTVFPYDRMRYSMALTMP